MGAIAGLICSPCTTAPLSAILLYIAQSGNLWLGGGTLYLYALGMGLPLILVTVFGNRLLPKSGPWMAQVKIAFGFVILALPVFLLERVLGDNWGLRLWSLLGVAFFAWAFIASLGATRPVMRIVQIVLLGAALVCARPLQDWAFGQPAAQRQAHLPFTTIKTVDDLNQALAQAKGRPVMLDLYADWCVACKEFEKYTFSDTRVQAALKIPCYYRRMSPPITHRIKRCCNIYRFWAYPPLCFSMRKATSNRHSGSRGLWMRLPLRTFAQSHTVNNTWLGTQASDNGGTYRAT
jgi:thiol:disulfide interchange protein DsbD